MQNSEVTLQDSLNNDPAVESDSTPEGLGKRVSQEEGNHDLKARREYIFDGEKGWRRCRILRSGRGIYYDIRRRLPYYRSDITDAFTYCIIASTIRMYFVK